jgi:hypothetical protein
MRRLHSGDGAVFAPGDFNQLLRWTFDPTHVKVVANQQQERLIADKLTTA